MTGRLGALTSDGHESLPLNKHPRLPHLARSAPLSFFRLKIADDPKETGDRVRVPKVARVLVALRFALVPQAAKVVDHALESLDVGHSRTISSSGHAGPLVLAHAADRAHRRDAVGTPDVSAEAACTWFHKALPRKGLANRRYPRRRPVMPRIGRVQRMVRLPPRDGQIAVAVWNLAPAPVLGRGAATCQAVRCILA